MQIDKLNYTKESLRKFGITLGLAFLVVSLLILLRHRHSPLLAGFISGILILFAFLAPGMLRIPYVLWMKLALILSWINTRLILIIFFYLIFSPIGIIMRLCGGDPLSRSIEKDRQSYWVKKERPQHSDYERQF